MSDFETWLSTHKDHMHTPLENMEAAYLAGQAAQKAEILMREDLFFCHDPMGQEALNKLEQFIRSQK